MSEASKGDLDTLTEENKVIPDYFGYYTREVADLFSQDDDFVPYSSKTFELAGRTHETVGQKDRTKQKYSGKDVNSFIGSGSLFSDAVGAGLSDIRKERLKAFLRQSVVSLTGEVDEVLFDLFPISLLAMTRVYKFFYVYEEFPVSTAHPCIQATVNLFVSILNIEKM